MNCNDKGPWAHDEAKSGPSGFASLHPGEPAPAASPAVLT